MSDKPQARPGVRGSWVLVLLIVLGLVPIVIAALLARTARDKALADPRARELLRDDASPPIDR